MAIPAFENDADYPLLLGRRALLVDTAHNGNVIRSANVSCTLVTAQFTALNVLWTARPG
jgi:hypothetical protein